MYNMQYLWSRTSFECLSMFWIICYMLSNRKVTRKSINKYKVRISVSVTKELGEWHKKIEVGSFDFRHVVGLVCRKRDGSGLIRNKLERFLDYLGLTSLSENNFVRQSDPYRFAKQTSEALA